MTKKHTGATIDELAIMTAKGFQGMGEQIKKEVGGAEKRIKEELTKELGGRIDEVEKDMATKEQVERLVAKVDGKSVERDRKIDRKVNILTAGLKKKKVIENATISSVENIAVFPQAAKGK